MPFHYFFNLAQSKDGLLIAFSLSCPFSELTEAKRKRSRSCLRTTWASTSALRIFNEATPVPTAGIVPAHTSITLSTLFFLYATDCDFLCRCPVVHMFWYNSRELEKRYEERTTHFLRCNRSCCEVFRVIDQKEKLSCANGHWYRHASHTHTAG